MKYNKQIGWVIMLLLALLMVVMAGRYFTLNPDVYFPEQRETYLNNTFFLLLHVGGGILATLLGPFQFLPSTIRTKYLTIHRWSGRIYLLAVLSGGLGGLYLAFLAYGGLPAKLGFLTLAVLWLSSAGMAYKTIRQKQIQTHRYWMIRNYAFTFAAVTLRLWQILFAVIGLEFVVGYIIVAWLSWLPNLLVAEWTIKRLKQTP